MFLKLLKLGKSGSILVAPEKKKQKERIFESPGFKQRYRNGVFSIQALPSPNPKHIEGIIPVFLLLVIIIIIGIIIGINSIIVGFASS
jgi:hypothetical protein